MHTDAHGLGECMDLRHEEVTHEIIGCAMEVLNHLGHGLVEKPYERALVVEFGLRHMEYAQQKSFELIYKEVKVGEFIPDLIVSGLVVVDTKVIERITDHELGQMLNYLKITKLQVGLILNFKRAKLEWKRVSL
jgi:GxxExxY protein